MAEIPEPKDVNLEEASTDPHAILNTRDLAIVNQTFSHYEVYRHRNHDPRWKVADELYFGVMPARLWEGTSMARANLSVPLCFDQIQAAMPIVVSSLFGTSGDWFQVEPEPGTSLQEALAQKAALRYVLEHPHKKYGGSALSELRLAIQSILTYGNGGVMLEYDHASKNVDILWADIRDIYVDPATPSPCIDESRSVICRRLMTVEELDALRDEEGFHIPSKDVLQKFANARPIRFADQTISQSEASRGIGYQPAGDDFLPNPGDRQCEVLIYWSPAKVIWVLNEKVVIYNERNEYGFVPYCFAPCYTVLRRFYAEGIPDKQYGNQRYVEALLNAHLDEISLNLNPPKVRAQGGGYNASAFRTRPGAVWETSGEPQKALWIPNPPQVTTNVFQDIAFIKELADSRTGVNSMMTSGQPLRSNASRTAAGIQAQAQSPLSRLQEIVENVEAYLVVPMLYKIQKMIGDLSEGALPGLTDEGKVIGVPSEVMKKKVKFRMLAASKMLTREKLQGLMPVVMQSLLAGPIMAEASKVGKTFDFDTFERFFQDATGTANSYAFYRQMTQQEQQAMSAPPPQVQMQMAMKQQDGQVRKDIMGMKVEADLQKAALSHQSKSDLIGEKSAVELFKLIAKDQEPKESEPPAAPPTSNR